MVELLELLGHEARGAYGLTQALDTLAQFTPQVALVDLNMPEADGYTVLRQLRERPGLGKVYAAAMTGYGQKADRQATLAAGFDAHLTKPVELEQLCEVLDAAATR
jgi:CheY-like chemotaxis protein